MEVKGVARAGILKKSKMLKATDDGSFKLIHRSITGVFEQEVDLLSEDLTPHQVKR